MGVLNDFKEYMGVDWERFLALPQESLGGKTVREFMSEPGGKERFESLLEDKFRNNYSTFGGI